MGAPAEVPALPGTRQVAVRSLGSAAGCLGFTLGHKLRFDPGPRIGSVPLFSHLGMGIMTVLTVLGYHEGWLDEFRSRGFGTVSGK